MSQRVVTSLQEAAAIASTAAARPSVKSTYKNLTEVLTAYWFGERKGVGLLIDALHGSPRLTQWGKVAEGYRLWSTDETLSVTVTSDQIYTTKGTRVDDLQSGLPAQALYNAIQTAQQIVQSNGSTESDDEYFKEGEEGYSDSAGLDTALEETHAAPLVEDDAELIEDVTTEDALDNDQREEDGTTPVVTVSQKFIEDISEQPKTGFTAKANRQNEVTDGVICAYCGNLNRNAYKGVCPQCPKIGSAMKHLAPVPGRDSASEAWLMGRLKSIQGRVLTIMDASPIADKAQREAVKTLINKEFRREMNRVSDGGWRAGNPRYEGE
jgi:hypothetical protein